MPVRHAVVGRHRTIGGLAKALFETGSDPDLQKRAEEALLRANPGLAAEGALVQGRPIVVPELGGARPKAPDLPPREEPGPAAPPAAETLVGRIEAAAKEAAERVKMLKRESTLQAIAKAHPELREKLPEIVAAVERNAARAKQAAKNLREAAARVEAAVEAAQSR